MTQLHGPLTRYAKLRVAHVLGMPGTFSPPPRVSDPDMHRGTCVTHVPWCMPGSLTSGFLWSQWRGKRSRHSRRMRNPQFCVSGKRPIADTLELHLSCTNPSQCRRSLYVAVLTALWQIPWKLDLRSFRRGVSSDCCKNRSHDNSHAGYPATDVRDTKRHGHSQQRQAISTSWETTSATTTQHSSQPVH